MISEIEKKRIAEELVVPLIGEFLDKSIEEGIIPARGWLEDRIDVLVDRTGYLERLYLCTLPQNWYHILWVASEETEYIRRKGLDLVFDLDPNSSTVSSIDLTPTQYCCVCPVFTCSSVLGPTYSRITILVNEAPVPDIIESTWLNVYVTQNLHVPTEGPPLKEGFLYTFAPKRKVKWTLKNRHPTESNTIAFFADYLEILKDNGYNLIHNCYEPFKKKIVEEMLKRRT